jgi:hypothetical protein
VAKGKTTNYDYTDATIRKHAVLTVCRWLVGVMNVKIRRI